MTLADAIFPYEECAVRNSTKCECITPAGYCSTYYGTSGDSRLCCRECDPPEAAAA
jgi:hypothetical protein